MKRNWLISIYLNPKLQPWLVMGVLLLVNICFWIAVVTTFPRTAPAAVLHYSVGIGIDFVGEGGQITVLPLAGSITLLLTALIAYILQRASFAAVWNVVGGNAVVQALLIAAYVYIYSLN